MRRRRYSPAEKAEMRARILAGYTTTETATALNVPQSVVQEQRSAALALTSPIDYRLEVIAQARAYAIPAWAALLAQAKILGDDQWLREHPQEAFALAGAHRVLVESLGRILAAIGG